MVKIEENIKDLARYLIAAADIADNLCDDPNIKGRERRLFGRIFNRVHKEWWTLCEHYDWFGIRVQNPSNKRCKLKKTNLGVQNPQLKLPLWNPSKDADRDGIINPKYKIT